MPVAASLPASLVRIRTDVDAEIDRLDGEIAHFVADRDRMLRVREAIDGGASSTATIIGGPRAARETQASPTRRRRRRSKDKPGVRERVLLSIEQRNGTATSRQIVRDTGLSSASVASMLSKIKREEGILDNDRKLGTWTRVKRAAVPTPGLQLAPEPDAEPAAAAA